jgi:chorismate-pyruvate lyase
LFERVRDETESEIRFLTDDTQEAATDRQFVNRRSRVLAGGTDVLRLFESYGGHRFARENDTQTADRYGIFTVE